MSTISDLLRTDVPKSTGATAVYAYDPKLERRYQFMGRFGGEPVLLHRVDGNVIHLPRGLCPVSPNDHRDPGERVKFPKCPEMRPDQEAWFGATVEFLKAGQSGVTVAGTGRGKTILGYYATYHVGVKTLVIATKDDIYKQWIDGAKKFLGLKDHEIGEIRGDKCEVVGTKFVVAMIHSLSRDEKYPDWITKGFGLVIFDEAHRVGAEQFSKVASMFPAKLRLGLSATPERADGKELLVYSHIGPVRVKAEAELLIPKVVRIHTKWQCPRRISRNPYTGGSQVVPMHHEAGKTIGVEKIMVEDAERNALLVSAIKDCYEKGRKTVVFSSLLGHLSTLHQELVLAGVPGKDIGHYAQASTKADRELREKVKVKPIILTTWGMMAEGTDIPWLDCCILATPRSSVNQPVGRVRRESEGKLPPVVIDFVDLDSPVFAGYARSRLRWYQGLGANIIDL